jgi:valyl-tRNA synthetase
MNKSIGEIDTNFRKFRISEALMTTYKLFWDEFSGWYLEIIKPEYQKPIDRITYDATVEVFDKLMKVIHPFMPFITEEIWQYLLEPKDGESIMISSMPDIRKYDKKMVEGFESIKEVVSAVRTVRKSKEIPLKEQVGLLILSAEKDYDHELLPVVAKLCNVSEIKFVSEKQEGATSFLVGTTEYFIPLAGKIDVEGELAKIREDIEYNRGFLVNVMKKLENERFINNAPANVLDLERKKKSDAESKIKSLEERMKELEAL